MRQRIASLISVIGAGALLALLAIEIGLRCCYIDSAGTLTYMNWRSRYWTANAEGYRDAEWPADRWAGRTVIAAIGDSFTAGWGVTDPAERYTDVLADRLGPEYAVVNLGTSASATVDHTLTLERFQAASGVTPNVVLLQYFLNDIDGALLALDMPIPRPNPPPLTQTLYLADFIHTRFGFDGAAYWRERYAAYDNAPVWEQHTRELHAFIDATEAIDARLIVVIFPELTDPVSSVAYVDRVAQVFAARGISDILTLSEAAGAWPVDELIVSPRDTHPSPALHARVADLLAARFFGMSAS